ncbi:NAD(P)-binding domain-containing protein, partial [Bordetella hinzii]|nr:NAD(P)-binding domain-containing protein [Bordetella hinzii]
MMDTVSIIGLGEAGARAARQLLARDWDVTVYDRDPGRGEAFRGQATLAGSAAEALRESRHIILALPDPRE